MSILVVVENVVVSRTNLREEDLVVTTLDPLVAGSHCIVYTCLVLPWSGSGSKTAALTVA